MKSPCPLSSEKLPFCTPLAAEADPAEADEQADPADDAELVSEA